MVSGEVINDYYHNLFLSGRPVKYILGSWAVITNQLLPTRLDHVPFYFYGDGCVGKGELEERAFSSARHVAKKIAAEAKVWVRQGSQKLP
jgi:hypothetical protein